MEALSDGTHLIHIGPQKTGSTTIQAALHRTRERLRELGVVYPGPGVRPRGALAEGLGYSLPGGGPQGSKQLWDKLLRQVHDPDARIAVISHEAFGRAGQGQARRTVEALGGDRPHVVAVARRYDRLMPSQWQQRVKAKRLLSYDEWLAVVLGDPAPDDPVWRNLWIPHDTVGLVERWAGIVGPENFTLIVADERDRSVLPRTFETLLGVPEGTLDLRAGQRNRSLTYGEVELLRHLNIRADEDGWSKRDYYRLVHRGVIPALVRADRVPDDPEIPPLPSWAEARLRELSDRRVEQLGGLGVTVVGDPEHLRLDASSAVPSSSQAAGPADRVPLVIADRALAGMAGAAIAERKRSRRQQRGRRRGRTSQPAPLRARSRLRRIWRRLSRRSGSSRSTRPG